MGRWVQRGVKQWLHPSSAKRPLPSNTAGILCVSAWPALHAAQPDCTSSLSHHWSSFVCVHPCMRACALVYPPELAAYIKINLLFKKKKNISYEPWAGNQSPGDERRVRTSPENCGVSFSHFGPDANEMKLFLKQLLYPVFKVPFIFDSHPAALTAFRNKVLQFGLFFFGMWKTVSWLWCTSLKSLFKLLVVCSINCH